jgi:prepilin-type N-terminal cleavage/methylation domain-containing protein
MTRKLKTQGFTLVEIMIVVLIIGILLAIAVPNWINARSQGQLQATVGNLKQIDTAKQQYAMQGGLPQGTAVTQAELSPTYIRVWPTGPTNGAIYLPQNVGSDPTYNGATAVQLQVECGSSGSGCPF